jgi:hypothetical protein
MLIARFLILAWAVCMALMVAWGLLSRNPIWFRRAARTLLAGLAASFIFLGVVALSRLSGL